MSVTTDPITLSGLVCVQVGHALRNSINDERGGGIAVIQMWDAKPQPLAQPLAHISYPVKRRGDPVRLGLINDNVLYH